MLRRQLLSSPLSLTSAYRNAAVGDALTRTSPPSLAACTACGWAVRLATTGVGYSWIVDWDEAGAGGSVVLLGWGAGTESTFEIFNNTTESGFPTNFGSNEIIFWALTNASAGNCIGYARHIYGGQLQNVSLPGANFTATQFQLGNNTSAEWFNGKIWNVKLWDAVLSERELMIESLFFTPQRRLNLHAWWPLEGVGNKQLWDYGPSGRVLTRAGAGRAEPWFLSPNQFRLTYPRIPMDAPVVTSTTVKTLAAMGVG